MRLLNKLPHSKYFFIVGFIGICISSIIFVFNTPFREQISYYELRWSPNGSKLAFMAIEDGAFYELFVIDADGSNLIQLTSRTYSGFVPMRWSGDSETIYYKLGAEIYREEVGTWYRTTLNPPESSFSSATGWNSIAPDSNPIVSQSEIDTSIVTWAETDEYYAVTICPDPRFQGDNGIPIDECEKSFEVYSVETDELVWVFGKCQYNETRYGHKCIILPFQLLPLSILIMGLGIIVAILRRFRKPDNRKSKPKVQEK